MHSPTRVSHKNFEGTKSTNTLNSEKNQTETSKELSGQQELRNCKNFEACSSRKKKVNIVLPCANRMESPRDTLRIFILLGSCLTCRRIGPTKSRWRRQDLQKLRNRCQITKVHKTFDTNKNFGGCQIALEVFVAHPSSMLSHGSRRGMFSIGFRGCHVGVMFEHLHNTRITPPGSDAFWYVLGSMLSRGSRKGMFYWF